MPLERLTEYAVIRVRLVLYVALILFSVVIISGIEKMRSDRGVCPLYLDGTIDNAVRSYSPPCNFPFYEAIFQLAYSVLRIGILIIPMSGRTSYERWWGFVMVEAVMAFFILICACVLSAGTHDTCSKERLECEKNWYGSSQLAQAGAWFSTYILFACGVVSFLFLYRGGKLPCVKQPPASEPPANNVSDAAPSYIAESGVVSLGVWDHPPSNPVRPPSYVERPPSYQTPPPSYLATPDYLDSSSHPALPGTVEDT
ncbi:uncharacterized protein LOC101862795 isoform X2 [Aplysia californica]|uniref:Uncharacterized protein LOC101862795 isoform X2 n=1 Tax=Aplysia californica TaxID=6500 RepID=A0ABM0JNH5_APLCA|nr:uncharacterized protein LOC101862795 isoform X2 [Aplysia californica]